MKRITAVFLISILLISFPLPAAAMDRAAAPVAPSSTLSIFGTLADIYQAAKNIFVPKEDFQEAEQPKGGISDLHAAGQLFFRGLRGLYR